MWNVNLGLWLTHSAIFGTLILLLGCVAVWRTREPIYRIAIIRWSFLACLIVPLVQQTNVLPTLSIPWLPSESSIDAAATATPRSTTDLSQGSQSAFAHNNHQMSFQSAVDSTTKSGTLVSPPDSFAGQSEFVSAGNVTNKTPPSSRVSEWSLSAPSIGRSIQLAYLFVVVLIVGYWCVGLLGRRWIVKRCTAADESLRQLFARIARNSIAGNHVRRARLLVSDHIDSPIMWGWYRPTIVVPRKMSRAVDAEALRWGLAHECSHVIHRDFLMLLVARLTKLVCFYQPGFWWLQRQMGLCQDFLADAFAAQHGGCSEDYAQYLVNLAGKRNAGVASVTLGIADRRANLLERVRMLVQSSRPPVQSQKRAFSLLIGAVACSIAITLCVVRLGYASDETTPAAKPNENESSKKTEAVVDQETLPDPITYQCKVVDRENGQPIDGARVEITLEHTADPSHHRHTKLETITAHSDAKGNYSFTIQPEYVAISSLYIVVDAHHPDYQSKGRSGYSHTMIRRNLENGEPPFYQTIQLSPGEPIFGRLVAPDGSPSKNTKITVYSKRKHSGDQPLRVRGAFQKSETDENGKFRVSIATQGDGVLWAYPENYSPIAIRLYDQRGDFGDIELKPGVRVPGRVHDAKGNPLVASVEARRDGDGEKADEFLGANAVANGIRASVTSSQDGHFLLPPLPAGNYSLEVSVGDADAKQRNLDHVFTRIKMTVPDEGPPEPVEVRALPHVIVRGRFFDAQGNPRASHDQHLFARYNGEFYFTGSTKPGKDGWFEFKVPHGSSDVQVNLITNEHSSLRWRLRPEDEFTYGHRADLGTLEEDFTTLEVIRYKAPMLLIKAVDNKGNPVQNFKPHSKYKTRSVNERMGTFLSGSLGDVGFEKQPDGRWRSSQLLPDDELTVTIVKEGFTTEEQKVTMKEGEERELVFVLAKKDE